MKGDVGMEEIGKAVLCQPHKTRRCATAQHLGPRPRPCLCLTRRQMPRGTGARLFRPSASLYSLTESQRPEAAIPDKGKEHVIGVELNSKARPDGGSIVFRLTRRGLCRARDLVITPVRPPNALSLTLASLVPHQRIAHSSISVSREVSSAYQEAVELQH